MDKIQAETTTNHTVSDNLDNLRLIPFRVSAEDAIRAYNEYYKNRPLLPSSMKKPLTADDFEGGFIPYLLYTGEADVSLSYDAQDTKKYDNDPNLSRQIRDYRGTLQAKVQYFNLPVNASQEVPDTFMAQLAPYHPRDLVRADETAEYADLAEMPELDVDPEKVEKALTTELEHSVTGTLSHSYSEVTKRDFRLHHEKTERVLLPVWVHTIRVGRRTYSFTVNGQTGTYTGSMPVSQGKSLLLFLASFGGSAAVFFLIARLIAMVAHLTGGNSISVTALLAFAFGFLVSSRTLSQTFEKMRVRKLPNPDSILGGSCESRILAKDEKLVQIQTVNKKNVTVKTEEF